MTETVKNTKEPIMIISIDKNGFTDVEFTSKDPILPPVIARAIRSVQVRYRQYRQQLSKRIMIENKQKKDMIEKQEISNARVEQTQSK